MSDDHKLTPEAWVKANEMRGTLSPLPGMTGSGLHLQGALAIPSDLVLAELARLTKERDEHRDDAWDKAARINQLRAKLEKVEAQLERMEASPQTADGLLAARLNVVERERDEARAEFHKLNDRDFEHINALERRAEKVERERDEWRANAESLAGGLSRKHGVTRYQRLGQAERERDAHRQAAEKVEAIVNDPWHKHVWERAKAAERAAAAMRVALSKVLKAVNSAAVSPAVWSLRGEMESALASDAGSDLLTREEAKEVVTRCDIYGQTTDSVIDEVIKEREQ